MVGRRRLGTSHHHVEWLLVLSHLSRVMVLAVSVSAVTGCQVLSTQTMGVAPFETVTEGKGGIAANGDPAACDEFGNPIAGARRPPAELSKMTLPTYRIEPPDVLLIQAFRFAPKEPYFIQPLDLLQVFVAQALPDQPIANIYSVEPSGIVNLGPSYGSVKVEGLTVDEATDAVSLKLRAIGLQFPEVSIQVVQPSGIQQIAGEHLVGPDGTISLGLYGSVYVAGLTLDEARAAVEELLSDRFSDPEVSVEIFEYRSKSYYIISEGAGRGDQVARAQITGNETVLDAISALGGLSQLSSKRIWISRPAPHGQSCDQVLPVDWDAITKGANTCTNYQLLPGDRVFISEDRFLALDSFVSKVLNPIERVFGFNLLAAQTLQVLHRFPAGF